MNKVMKVVTKLGLIVIPTVIVLVLLYKNTESAEKVGEADCAGGCRIARL